MNFFRRTSKLLPRQILHCLNSNYNNLRLSANTGSQCQYSIWNQHKTSTNNVFDKRNHIKYITDSFSLRSNETFYQNSFILNKRNFSNKTGEKSKIGNEKEQKIAENVDPNKSLGLFARFKQMSKQYWYVLLPVHIATSCCWFGGFYYLSSSGVDIVGLLESIHLSETIISKLRDSSMGHIAIAYVLYKIATPARYTVTLGGTTYAIKYLSRFGYIKPMPSKQELKQLYQDQKAKTKQIYEDQKAKFKQKE